VRGDLGVTLRLVEALREVLPVGGRGQTAPAGAEGQGGRRERPRFGSQGSWVVEISEGL